MADELTMKRAQNAFATLCRTLDGRELKYRKDEERLMISITLGGDDIPMELIAAVDAERQFLQIMSFLPGKFPEDKLLDGAIAATAANYRISHGAFDLGMKNGKIAFRITNSYRGMELTSDAVDYLMVAASHWIDEYNDKFLMLAKGLMTLEQFLAAGNKE